MNDLLVAILEIWLPSKLPRLVAALTGILLIGICNLSNLVPYIGLRLSTEEMSHIQTMVIPWLLILSLAIIHHLVVNEYRHKISQRNLQEKRELFRATIETIKERTKLDINLINEFKSIFEKNKYFINPKQEKTLVALISDLSDIRIDDEELKSNNLSAEERNRLVVHRRKLLNRIESIEITVEKYLRKLT